MEEDGVLVTWSPPGTHDPVVIDQSGCFAVNAIMDETVPAFERDHRPIEIKLESGTNELGFTRLLDGEADVAQASRRMTGEERDSASARGLDIVEIKVAVECVAVVVGPGLNITSLQTEEVRGLFNGSIENWSSIGGPDLPVKLVGTEKGQSTYNFFNATIMKGDRFAPDIELIGDSFEAADVVTGTAGAVGFLLSGAVEPGGDLTAVDLEDADGIHSIDRSEEVHSFSYPLARGYYVYTNGTPKGALGTWMSYVLDEQGGQAVAADLGFVPLLEEDREAMTELVEAPVKSYTVHREGGGETREFETNQTLLMDTDVSPGTEYSYWVSAVYGGEEGDGSTAVAIEVPSDWSRSGDSSGEGPGGSLILAVAVGALLGLASLAAFVRRGRGR